MFEHSDTTRRLVAIAAVLAPALTLATVSASPVRDGSIDAKSAVGYQIRCWQHGRLLFEENQVTLPADGARQAVKISAADRDGRPIYVAATDGATCLIRPSGESLPSHRTDVQPGR